MIHHAKGTISRQSRVNTPEGTYEEGFGHQGFYGLQATLYRQHPTTDWLRIEGPLQPRALRTYDVVPDDMVDAQGLPATLLYNDDVRISVSRRRESMPFFFNIDTEQPLQLTDLATTVEIPDDYTNWMRRSPALAER
jgi:homogentisate 1,2-dioxygenase